MKKLIALLLTLALVCASVSALALTFDHASFVSSYNSSVQETFNLLFGTDNSQTDAIVAASRLSLKSTSEKYIVYANSTDTFELVFSVDGSTLSAWVDLNGSVANLPIFGLITPLYEMDPSIDMSTMLSFLNSTVGPQVTTGHFSGTEVLVPLVCDSYQFIVH